MADFKSFKFCFFIIFKLYFIPFTVSELYPYVTCGSVVKLMNNNFNVRLHSHEVKYGTGSQQQGKNPSTKSSFIKNRKKKLSKSITAVDQTDDVNSHWVVKGKSGKTCNRGEPIACGTTIRLEHLATGKNLHSHHFPSPLSNNQEVSAFGESGEGDSGDNWTVVCSSDFWERSGTIRLKHADTDMFMTISGHTYGRPIAGQKEVCAISYSDSNCYWKTAEGVFIKPSDSPKAVIGHIHSEL